MNRPIGGGPQIVLSVQVHEVCGSLRKRTETQIGAQGRLLLYLPGKEATHLGATRTRGWCRGAEVTGFICTDFSARESPPLVIGCLLPPGAAGAPFTWGVQRLPPGDRGGSESLSYTGGFLGAFNEKESLCLAGLFGGDIFLLFNSNSKLLRVEGAPGRKASPGLSSRSVKPLSGQKYDPSHPQCDPHWCKYFSKAPRMPPRETPAGGNEGGARRAEQAGPRTSCQSLESSGPVQTKKSEGRGDPTVIFSQVPGRKTSTKQNKSQQLKSFV